MAPAATAAVGWLNRRATSVQPLDPALLIRAYAAGLFPMAESRAADGVFWVEPKRRGVLPLDGFHLPASLARTLRRELFRVTVDEAFDAVLDGCAEPAGGREETWINATIADAVSALHGQGYAHSVECWDGGVLAGGLYGVALGAAFFGESMFSRATDASKVALAALVARLRAGGFRLLDTQFLTDHLARFGAVEVSRDAYKRQLAAAVSVAADWRAFDRLLAVGEAAGVSPGKRIAQALSQTS